MAITQNSKYSFLELPDCAGLSDTGKCLWLNIPSCQGDTCSFKKSTEEISRSRYIVKDRLSLLDSKIQEKISKKYFKGQHSWK